MTTVQTGSGSDFAESCYFEQLRILAQLRKLDFKISEALESITKYFKEEKDSLFRRGDATGEARSRREIGAAMKKYGIPIEQIARFTKLAIEEI